jgi:hypothetical protein
VLNIDYEDKVVKAVFKAVPGFVDRVKGRVEKLGGVFKPGATRQN